MCADARLCAFILLVDGESSEKKRRNPRPLFQWAEMPFWTHKYKSLQFCSIYKFTVSSLSFCFSLSTIQPTIFLYPMPCMYFPFPFPCLQIDRDSVSIATERKKINKENMIETNIRNIGSIERQGKLCDFWHNYFFFSLASNFAFHRSLGILRKKIHTIFYSVSIRKLDLWQDINVLDSMQSVILVWVISMKCNT